MSFTAQDKVSGNRWIAQRANNETKDSQGASTARLTRPKHVALLVPGINNWDFCSETVQGLK